jgi:hypothetical protein
MLANAAARRAVIDDESRVRGAVSGSVAVFCRRASFCTMRHDVELSRVTARATCAGWSAIVRLAAVK